MKIASVLITLAFTTTSFSCTDSSAKKSVNNMVSGFAVVELFTSEGCSSCPPADIAVAKLLKEHSSNVYVLGYHVDYWDKYGWKDIFSNHAYTQRQGEYAKTFKLSSVYTPQIIVNGTEQFVGSNKGKLNAVINKDLQEASNTKLNIDAKSTCGKTVAVNYSSNADNADLKIALIQLNAENKIQRGENSGATLHHVNVVRDIKTITATANGNIELAIPPGLSPKDCGIIAFVQDTADNKIMAATEATIR